MILIGLTGSIGMGKSTTSAMFSEAGVPVWDADAAVEKIAALLPDCVTGEGAARAVDRAALRAAATSDPAVIPALEKIAHPLVGEDRETFIADAKARGCDMAVCDVPLLYETGGETRYDAVVVVSAPAEVQRERVMARPGMTEATFRTILAKQTPDAEKRARADHVVDTSQGIEAARAQVQAIIADLRGTA